MEKPSAAPILLGAGALVVLVALGVLVVKVRASAPEPDLAPQEIASAQARTAAASRESSSQPAARPGGMIGAPAGIPRPPGPRAAAAGDDDEGGAPGPSAIASPEATLERVGKAGMDRAGDDGDDDEGGAGTSAKQVEANQLYDRGDYEAAAQLAEEILKDDPDNARVLRIAASSACVMGEGEKAKGYYARLSPRDQRKIARRCQRYGIEF